MDVCLFVFAGPKMQRPDQGPNILPDVGVLQG